MDKLAKIRKDREDRFFMKRMKRANKIKKEIIKKDLIRHEQLIADPKIRAKVDKLREERDEKRQMEEEKKKINKMNKGLEVGIEGGYQDEEKDVVMKPEKILSVRKKMKLKQNCCDNLSQCPTENTNVIGKKDLEVAYIINNFLPFCTGNFENYCGTFLEIHTPGSEIILQEIQISKTFSSGFQTLFLSTKKLCAGKYEIWMVMRMRGVNYLMVVKPFYVKYPSCTCEEILNHGFSC